MSIAVRVEKLSKHYPLGQSGGRAMYRTLRESLANLAKAPLRFCKPRDRAAARDFWALRDVNFEVGAGDVVGIIGRNGAGKSTLLKVLSRITRPTTGQARLYGRVSSLLEVGTGFHPELTGRENVYLNGSILGMRRREIARRFDEIVAFAEVERFLDTPVKRYSSGMYVRLAFAVAAHLEPEILIVDEVLAVGDARFQKKCLGKMALASRSGRTVFYVSHNLESVQRLCQHALLMDQGRLVAQGRCADVIARYLSSALATATPGQRLDLVQASRRGTQEARFVSLGYTSGNPATANRAFTDGPLEVFLEIESDAERCLPGLAVALFSREGVLLVNADIQCQGETVALRAGVNQVRFVVEQVHLKPGNYVLGLWMGNLHTTYDHIESVAELEIVDAPGQGLGVRPACDGCVTCSFRVEH